MSKQGVKPPQDSIVGNLATAIDMSFTLTEWIDKMQRLYRYADNMLESLHEYLTDPDHPDRYSMLPRAEEMEVIYREIEDDPDSRSGFRSGPQKKALLQDLIELVESDGRKEIVRITNQMSDPRKLLLDFIKAISSLNEKLIDMRNRDISWMLEAKKIQLEQDELAHKKGEGMSVQDQLKTVTESLAEKMAGVQSRNLDLMRKVGLPVRNDSKIPELEMPEPEEWSYSI